MPELTMREQQLYSALGVLMDNRDHYGRDTAIGSGVAEVSKAEADMLVKASYAFWVQMPYSDKRGVSPEVGKSRERLRKLEVKMGIRNPEQRRLEHMLGRAVK